MKPGLALALLVLCAAGHAHAQTSASSKQDQSSPATATTIDVDPQKAADIRRLMEVTGAVGLGEQVMRGMLTELRPTIENSLPPGEYRAKLVDLFLAKFQSMATVESLLAMVIPIYDKHFSDEEIRQLIAFYETPIGREAVVELPKVVAESQQVGGEWGRTLGRESFNEVLAEHPELKKALEDAQKHNSAR